MNSDRSNKLSLKYQRFTLSGCRDIGIRKFEFVAKTQFLCSTPTSHNPSLGSCNDVLSTTKSSQKSHPFWGTLYIENKLPRH